MNRREFMMGAAVAAAMGGCMTTDAEDPKPCRKTSAAADKLPARNRHPYKDVDWATALQIRGTSTSPEPPAVRASSCMPSCA